MAKLRGGVAQVANFPAALAGRSAKRACPLHQAHHRFAQLAKTVLRCAGQARRATRLVVQQHRGKHRSQVPAHARAVGIEGAGHARHISRAGVAGHQPLNHLLAEKRPDVGVVEQRVQRDFERCGTARARRDAGPQKVGRQCRVVGRRKHHGRTNAVDIGDGAVAGHYRVGTLAGVNIPAGEHPGNVGHIRIAVRFNLVAVGVALFSAVKTELIEADGEQLHDFPAKVFVGLPARRHVFFHVALDAQKRAHGRVERDAFQQGAVVAKRIGGQQVPPGGGGLAAPVKAQAAEGQHEKFRQGQRHPLPHAAG